MKTLTRAHARTQLPSYIHEHTNTMIVFIKGLLISLVCHSGAFSNSVLMMSLESFIAALSRNIFLPYFLIFLPATISVLLTERPLSYCKQTESSLLSFPQQVYILRLPFTAFS